MTKILRFASVVSGEQTQPALDYDISRLAPTPVCEPPPRSPSGGNAPHGDGWRLPARPNGEEAEAVEARLDGLTQAISNAQDEIAALRKDRARLLASLAARNRQVEEMKARLRAILLRHQPDAEPGNGLALRRYLIPIEPEKLKVYELSRPRSYVGRGTEADLCIADPTVSRLHGVLYFIGGATIVEDARSTNGTFVNGERVEQATVKDGDEVAFGRALFQFRVALPEGD